MTALADLHKLLDAATSGPWYVVPNDLIGGVSVSTANQPVSAGRVAIPADMISTDEDAALIVALRNHADTLLDIAEAAQDVSDRLGFVISRSEQMEAELTRWNVPVNTLHAAVARLESPDG